jgi:alpha-L-glutamate ligase-like protein
MKLTTPAALRTMGIMGMNQRNVRYISHYNERRYYPRVDDKFATKELATEYGIRVPELYGVIRYQHELKHLDRVLGDHRQFVVKPSQGSAGKGIMVIVDRDGDRYVKPSGESVTLRDIKRHISNTLSGLYSLGGKDDKALIEYAIQFTAAFEGFSFQGVPDIRVIVFQGFPVMAMMRLSTKASDGKANLHQGAVGVGINVADGTALRGVQFNRTITEHPDTNRALCELVVPQWDELIHISAQCYEMTELGYIGADVVLDKNLGPMILELNARPGLAIQIANGQGLLKRLERVEALGRKGLRMQPEERVAFAKHHFA